VNALDQAERNEAIDVVVRRAAMPPEKHESYRKWRARLELAIGIAVPLALLLIWEIGARVGLIDARFYPAPLASLARGFELMFAGGMTEDILATLSRTVFGFLIGTVFGLVFGVAMGWSRLLRRSLEPTLNGLYVVPKLAILPVFLTIFGFGEASLIAIVAVTVFFFVWIDSMEAVASVDAGYREAAISFGAARWELFSHVILPASLPKIMVGLRVSIGVAVLVDVAAEFVVAQSGLGFLIFNSRSLFQLEITYAGIVIVSVLGVLLQEIIRWVGKALTPWQTGQLRG
jgi:sulfonate transport system permease protein